MRSPLLYLSEMLAAIEAIEDFTLGMNREAFLDDEKTKSAVVRQFEILGEASKSIPYEIRSLAPDLHWGGIAGMRDRLVHDNWECRGSWRSMTLVIGGNEPSLFYLLFVIDNI